MKVQVSFRSGVRKFLLARIHDLGISTTNQTFSSERSFGNGIPYFVFGRCVVCLFRFVNTFRCHGYRFFSYLGLVGFGYNRRRPALDEAIECLQINLHCWLAGQLVTCLHSGDPMSIFDFVLASSFRMYVQFSSWTHFLFEFCCCWRHFHVQLFGRFVISRCDGGTDWPESPTLSSWSNGRVWDMASKWTTTTTTADNDGIQLWFFSRWRRWN